MEQFGEISMKISELLGLCQNLVQNLDDVNTENGVLKGYVEHEVRRANFLDDKQLAMRVRLRAKMQLVAAQKQEIQALRAQVALLQVGGQVDTQSLLAETQDQESQDTQDQESQEQDADLDETTLSDATLEMVNPDEWLLSDFSDYVQ